MLCIDPLDSQLTKAVADSELKEVVVDTNCGAALLRGAHIYAPGVLAMESNTEREELVNVYADLDGKCKRGTVKRYESPNKVFLGTGKVLMQRYQLFNNAEKPASGVAADAPSAPVGEFTGPPFPCESFDRILLDAPCSGLGNRPQLSCSIKQVKVLSSYPHIQRRLFEQAVQLVRPGGILVYSTCTVTEDECECLVAWALRKFVELRLTDATPRWGGPGLPLPGFEACKSRLLQRFGPSGANADTVGFFIAKFQKI